MNWSAKIVQHKKEPRIAVYFEYNPQLAERINEFEGAKWSQTLKAWHVPDTEENRIRFKIISHLYTLPSAEGIESIEKFKQWLRSKRYSESTLSTYSDALKSFLVFYREKPIAKISNQDIIVYNNEFKISKNDTNIPFSAFRVRFVLALNKILLIFSGEL